MSPFWTKIMTFEVPFRIVFSSFFWMTENQEKCLFFNTFMGFPIVFHWFFMFFQNRSTGQFLEGPSAKLVWKNVLGCHFRFSWFSKRHPLDHLFTQVDETKRSTPNDPCCPSRDPAFHEIIVFALPCGPSVFLLRQLFNEDWQIFAFCLPLLCDVFYMSCLSQLSRKPTHMFKILFCVVFGALRFLFSNLNWFPGIFSPHPLAILVPSCWIKIVCCVGRSCRAIEVVERQRKNRQNDATFFPGADEFPNIVVLYCSTQTQPKT